MADNNAFKISEIPAIVNLNTHVAPIIENLSGYPPFDLCPIPTYMNNQLYYYHMISAMFDADKATIKNQLKDHKALLKLINWDENTWKNFLIKHSFRLRFNK